jgi:tetratricopeptide (TPR) repeat protein
MSSNTQKNNDRINENNYANVIKEILGLEKEIINYKESIESLSNIFDKKVEEIIKKTDIDYTDEKKLFDSIIKAIKTEKILNRYTILYDFCNRNTISNYSFIIIIDYVLNKLNYPHQLKLNERDIYIKGKDVVISAKLINNNYFILENVKPINENKKIENIYLSSNNKNNENINENNNKTLLMFIKLYYAFFYQKAGNIDKVIEIVKSIDDSRLDSSYIALNMLAYSYFVKRDFKSAEEYIDKSIKINPKLPDSFILKGSILFNNDKFDEALKYFKKSLKLDNKNIISLHLSSYIYYKSGLFEEALKNYNKLITIGQLNKDFNILYNKAFLEYRLNKKEFNKTIENALKYAENSKNKEEALFLKAKFLLRNENSDSTIDKILRISDELTKINSQYLAGITKIQAFNKSGNYEKALNIINSMLKDGETYELLAFKALALSKIKDAEYELYKVINKIVNFAKDSNSLNIATNIIAKSKIPNTIKEGMLLRILRSKNYDPTMQNIIIVAASIFINSLDPNIRDLGFRLFNSLNNTNYYKILNESISMIINKKNNNSNN